MSWSRRLEDFESNPFFNHHTGLRFPSFPYPFDHPVFNRPALDHRSDRQVAIARRDPFHSSGFLPFGGEDPLRRMFQNFDPERAANDPNAQTFSSSSVMMYSAGGKDGRPKYYQATSSSSKAPGGIRESHRAVCDSESGIQKMSVGHHIGDQGHVLEHSVNHRTGVREEKRDFLNIDEADGHAFAREWEERAKPYNRVYQSLPYKPKGRTHRTEKPAAVGHDRGRVRIKTPAHGMGGKDAGICDPAVRAAGPSLEGQRARKSKKTV